MHTIAQRVPPPSGRPPLISLVPQEVEDLAAELTAYHALFAPLFRRTEQRHWARKYLEGQLLQLERKSIEPMALALEGGNVQALQQFISLGLWEDAAILRRHCELVAQSLGDPTTGVLIIDGCDFPKQGHDSVGVARQWCGALGKVANCQASVLAAYASARGATLVDRRLYLPEQWFTPEYAARRAACGVPTDCSFQTRAELAAEMIMELARRRTLPFSFVTCDEGFGQNPVLLDQIASAGLSYLAEVPHITRVWSERPPLVVPPPTRKKGHPFTRPRLASEAPAPVAMAELAATIPATNWRREWIKEGSKGPILAEVAMMRAVAVRDTLPGPDVWVVFRRSLGATRELKAYLCNAPATIGQETLVWLLGMRWPIEVAIRECKEELGMDHYEVRGWVGWHHHLTMTLLAHHFLVRLQQRWGEKSGGGDGAAGASPAARDLAPAAARRGNRAASTALYPAAELSGLSLPLQTPPAQHVLTQLTL